MRIIIFLVGLLLLIKKHYWAASMVWIWGEVACSFIDSIRGQRTSEDDTHTNTQNDYTDARYQEYEVDAAYMILGVDHSASDNDIKNAYRKMALTYHPDVSSDPSSTQKFRVINSAYERIKSIRGIK